MADFKLIRYRGDTFILPVALTDSQGRPVDLSGAAIKFKLGTITEISEGYEIFRNDTAGEFCIMISSSLMGSLGDPGYLFAAKIVYPSGVKETLFVGRLILKEDVVP